MNVLMTSDVKFYKGFITSLYSLLSHTEDNVRLYVTGISTKKILSNKKIRKFYKVNKLNIISADFIFENEEVNFLKFVRERFPIVSIHRVLAPFLIRDVDKLLYLDSDMLVLKNLSYIYDKDFSEAIVAVKDFENGRKDSDVIKDTYFNSGFLLFNCRKIRQNYSLSDVYEILEKFSNRIYYPDQDILNLLFNHDKKLVSFSYNHQIRDYYKDNIHELESENIVHFVGMPKPWMFKFKNIVFLKLYWEYCNRCFSRINYFILILKRSLFYMLVFLNKYKKRLLKNGK